MIVWFLFTVIIPIVLGIRAWPRKIPFPGCPSHEHDWIFNKKCRTGTLCYYGKECCCSKCYKSKMRRCYLGKWRLTQLSDRCLGKPRCPTIYDPVCGRDKRTYFNSCHASASCANISIACKGECPCCSCEKHYRPVCGKDGNTHWNVCTAGCKGTTVKCKGKCPCRRRYCRCPRIYHPVCGKNGITYYNSCIARCKGVRVRCTRKCPCLRRPRPRCICFMLYRPVCGVDGKVYTNKCVAKCSGVAICVRGCRCKGFRNNGTWVFSFKK